MFTVSSLRLQKHRYKTAFIFFLIILVGMFYIYWPDMEYCTTNKSFIPSFHDYFIKRISTLRKKLRKNICSTIFIPIPKGKFSFPKTTNHSDCSLPYISVNDKGQLGNKICQYLSLIFLQDFFDVRIAIHPIIQRTLATKFKNISAPILDSKCHSAPTFNLTYDVLFRRLYYHASKGINPQSKLRQSFFIKDYPCPAQLLAHFRGYVKSKLEILDEVKTTSEVILQSQLYASPAYDMTKKLVSVHVRRGDYFHHMKILYNRTVLSACYYLNAFNYYREKFKGNVLFIVSSDDLGWCKKHLSAPDVIITGDGETTDPIFDFTMLSLADHHIRGLGTFGFLSAFFGNGTIMFPLVDTSKPSDIEASYICSDTDDYIPMLDESLER